MIRSERHGFKAVGSGIVSIVVDDRAVLPGAGAGAKFVVGKTDATSRAGQFRRACRSAAQVAGAGCGAVGRGRGNPYDRRLAAADTDCCAADGGTGGI